MQQVSATHSEPLARHSQIALAGQGPDLLKNRPTALAVTLLPVSRSEGQVRDHRAAATTGPGLPGRKDDGRCRRPAP
jgi:hypothetical protein